MKKDTVLLYANQYAALQRLTNEQMGMLFHAIFQWLNGDFEPPDDWNDAVFLAFQFLTLQISIDSEKYLHRVERAEKRRKENANRTVVKEINTTSRARVDDDGDVDVDEDVDVDVDVDVDESINRQMREAPANTTQDTEQSYLNFIHFWNQAIEQTGAKLRKVRMLNDGRRKRIAAIQQQMPGKEAAQAIYNIMRSPFCNGDTKARNRPVDFDWVTQIENFTAALEGNL